MFSHFHVWGPMYKEPKTNQLKWAWCDKLTCVCKWWNIMTNIQNRWRKKNTFKIDITMKLSFKRMSLTNHNFASQMIPFIIIYAKQSRSHKSTFASCGCCCRCLLLFFFFIFCILMVAYIQFNKHQFILTTRKQDSIES